MPRPWDQLRSLVFLSNEEMVKKDDDHPKDKTGPVLRNPHWQPTTQIPTRRKLRRGLTLIGVALAVWFLLSYLSLDLGFDDHARSRYSYSSQDTDGGHTSDQATGPKGDRKSGRDGFIAVGTGGGPGPGVAKAVVARNFNGPIKFTELASSLNAIAGTRGSLPHNQNVLFFAGSLKSASKLLPMACEMGKELRSYVHFALASRDAIEVEDLLRVNGIDKSCQIFFHDARADHLDIATDARMQHSTTRALYHINNYMHPQAVIIDGTEQEEIWFQKGAKAQAEIMAVPLIQLPEDASKRLSWITKLDSASLAAWDKMTIDILIQAPSKGSGSLLRLLKSLNELDFAASSIPHLTIELPSQVEVATTNFLKKFRWPPAKASSPGSVQMLSLSHRIPRQRMTEEESAIRFLESFWPNAPNYSHILVLSPRSELTPQFFHYLKFSILEYRYSNLAHVQRWDQRLLGISMTVPSTTIGGDAPFKAPDPIKPDQRLRSAGRGAGTSFLWQSPHSDAVVFMGDKWTELHVFLGEVLERQHSTAPPAMLTEKAAGKQYPAWLEHMLRLSRARGYFTLYPSGDTSSALVTIHSDLAQPPDEYAQEQAAVSASHINEKHEAASAPLLGIKDTLPRRGALAPFEAMPLLGWDGKEARLEELDRTMIQYKNQWRRLVGGCSDDGKDSLETNDAAKELFCN